MERKIIVEDRITPEKIPLTPSGYPAGLVLRSQRNNRLYKVDQSGAFRRPPMYEVNRQPLITEVRCQKCHASMEVNTDSRRMVEKSITEFQKHHHCRSIENKES